jgi:predicted PurR-regulated permease PerM
LSRTQDSLNRAIELLEKKTGFIPKGAMQNALQQKISDLTSKTGDVGSLLRVVKEWVTIFILTQVVAFFLLKDGRRIRKIFIAFVPNKYFETFLTLLHEIDRQISNYIRGQLADAFFVGVLAIVGLYSFGVNYAMFIGALAGIANIIPYIGPILGITVGGLLVLIDTGSIFTLSKAVGILAFVKLIDSVAISPLVVSRSVNVHPLMIMMVISVGGLLHGVWGMLLSVPLYCSMRVSLRILYRGLVEYGNW